VSLPESLLVRNVIWFCSLRWIVVGLLLAFGALGLFGGALRRIGLRPHPEWPFVAAAALAAANLAFLAHARRLVGANSHGARGNLAAQIGVDLLALTVVVHYMGSLETYVAFAYLFHIVLACIFFPRSWSFAVTSAACVLYAACVALEAADVLPAAGIYASAALRDQMDHMAGVRVLNVSWATLTLAVVWYLASHLSAMVRARDSQLAETNRRLLEAQEERTRYMLRTTHELKAPFAAIHANAQLLLKGHCGELPDAAHEVAVRVAARCRRLATEIQEMLQLANLRFVKGDALRWVERDLADILQWCLAQARPVAEERGVVLTDDLRAARVVGVEDHLKMLFGNLLANAINYSLPGGSASVQCTPSPGDGPVVTVADHGIGIAREKLPRIFDAYYRTDEAVLHNRESTGLGLAIAAHVAQMHGVRVRVESAPGVGTKFILQFPPAGETPERGKAQKEDRHGLRDDRGRRRGLRQRGGESPA
jgi:signal transduction histidine kinase